MGIHQTEQPVFEIEEFGRPFAPRGDENVPRIPINPDEWQHVCSCRFGEARGGSIKWTGDSYRYDIFEQTEAVTHRRTLALRWWNGAGQGWLLTEDESLHGKTNLLSVIITMPIEERRWDACHFLWNAAHKSAVAAARAAEVNIKRAFVEGRLKKKKKKGQYTVAILTLLELEKQKKGKTSCKNSV